MASATIRENLQQLLESHDGPEVNLAWRSGVEVFYATTRPAIEAMVRLLQLDRRGPQCSCGRDVPFYKCRGWQRPAIMSATERRTYPTPPGSKFAGPPRCDHVPRTVV